MGSCVSVHKSTASAVKLRFSIESKNEKVLVASPVKETTDLVNGRDRAAVDVAPEPQLSPARLGDAGSKDEAFFDSQPWLDSDCEDDFVSVNGDFTPSRGSTPIHHTFSSSGNPRPSLNRSPEETTAAGPTSSPDKKRRLSELFKESTPGDQIGPDESPQNGAHLKVGLDVSPGSAQAQKPRSMGGTPYLSRPGSRTSSERTPNSGGPKKEDKAFGSCLPRLISNRSFSERRKKGSNGVERVE